MNMPRGNRAIDLKAMVYAIDEHGNDILKERTEIQIPMLFEHMSEFEKYVTDFVGVQSITEEVGFETFDVILYRYNETHGRFAMRTQAQYSLEMRKIMCNQSDLLEIMICKKIMAYVKGRLGSILIVPMEGGSSSRHKRRNPQPVVFQNNDVREPTEEDFSTVAAQSTQNSFDQVAYEAQFEKRRRRNPQKVEDYTLYEKIKEPGFVTRNERQQANFEELSEMLKELSGSVALSEGKFLCGSCGKQRLVCPNRNNVGRVKYFRRKHYDKCLATAGRGLYRRDAKECTFYYDTEVGGIGHIEAVNVKGDGDVSREVTPTGSVNSVAHSSTSNLDDSQCDTMFIKQETGI